MKIGFGLLLVVSLSVGAYVSWRVVYQNPQNKESMTKNRLAFEKSPYLLQHADNPVDWYPWGEEAFEKARQEDKPIFLSIGYSTCHWCHVMAHESFEDQTVADMLNKYFVSIKVDREERPDVDHIYMTACQMMTGSGGWPLTIVMTPDKKPFFSGTYFPKEDKFGRMGLLTILEKLKSLWWFQRESVLDSAQKIVQALSQTQRNKAAKEFPVVQTLQNAANLIYKSYDAEQGGFGNVPKFPIPHQLRFLLRAYQRSPDEQHILKAVTHTMDAMRAGGIYDHLGFGFHRYSTDARWQLPHFEKMLYDQAGLLLAYAEASKVTQNKVYTRVVDEIAEYLLREMQSPQGGFYSAEDADSEGEEGAFYVWQLKELQAVLSDSELAVVKQLFTLTSEGNFVDPHVGHATERNVLFTDAKAQQDTALLQKFEKIRPKLLKIRKSRMDLHKDDKVLMDWNGFMIASLARSGYLLDRTQYIQAAQQGMHFLLNAMVDADGYPIHLFRKGKSDVAATCDDYAYLIWALIELYEATLDVSYLEKAKDFQSRMVDLFWDKEEGGFFMSAQNTRDLIVRPKEFYDGAMPAANSIALLNLLRLGQLFGNAEWLTYADKVMRAYAFMALNHPSQATQALIGFDYAFGPKYEVVIVGIPNRQDTEEMLAIVKQSVGLRRVIIFKPGDGSQGKKLNALFPFTKAHQIKEGKATAYVCKNYVCHEPTTDLKKMETLLRQPNEDTP